MGKTIDLSGQRFGRLLVISRDQNKGKQSGWLCLCDCAKTTVIAASSLKNGLSKSCGCYRNEISSKRATKHSMAESQEYGIWQAMKRRCNNKNNPDFHRYGGRGITVCQRWMDSFANFYADMGKRPHGHSIDRIDVNGNYEPLNCKWSDSIQQANNKSTNVRYEYGDETHTIAEWARISGIPQTLLRKRLHDGIKMPYALYNIDYRSVNAKCF